MATRRFSLVITKAKYKKRAIQNDIDTVVKREHTRTSCFGWNPLVSRLCTIRVAFSKYELPRPLLKRE